VFLKKLPTAVRLWKSSRGRRVRYLGGDNREVPEFGQKEICGVRSCARGKKTTGRYLKKTLWVWTGIQRECVEKLGVPIGCERKNIGRSSKLEKTKRIGGRK